MKNILKIDYDKQELIMDREFSIKASVVGSQEYDILQTAKQQYTDFKIVRKRIKTNPKKEAFNGLTYEYMEMYMDKYNVSQEIRKQYEDLRFKAKAHSIRYPVIKKWFLETFPDMKDWGKIKEELDAATAA